MSYNPTENQKSIIEEKNKGIIVSASAGSGKTSTMIARITNLIESNLVKPDRLLVLTFTNAAASDMREKLIANLEKSVKSKKIKFDTIFEIVNSNISTIDSFCQMLVRKYCYEVGIDPNFSVIDETAKSLLMENAFSNLVVKLWLKKDPVILSLINTFSENRRIDDLKNVVFNLYNNFCVLEKYQDILTLTKQSFDKDLTKNLAANYYINYVQEVVSETLNKINEIEKNISSEENLNYISLIKQVVASLNVDNYLKLCEVCKIFSKPKKPIFRKDEFKKAESEFIKNELNDYLDEIQTIVDLLKDNISYSDEILEIALKNSVNIFTLTESFRKEYLELKLSRYALDFSDIEELAFKILNNKKIQKEVISNFDYVFIDEYQDVNLMQAKLIENVSGQDIFAVGDAKQSIYGFRLTSPEIFMANFNVALNKNSKIKAKILTENFRSTNSILRFVNFVFEKIMTEKTSGMLYDDNAKFTLTDNNENAKCNVNVIILKKNNEKAKLPKYYSVKDVVDETNSSERQATIIANIINDSLIAGYKEKDIVLLCRSKSKTVLEIYKKLLEIGFNVNVNFDFDIKETYETSLINNFLYLINNYKNDVYLYSVLTDLYNLSANDLTIVRTLNRDSKFFYEAVEKFINNYLNSGETTLNEIAKKLNKLYVDLSNLNLFSQNNNVYNVAKKIIEDFDIRARLSSEQFANLNNISKFLSELKKLEMSVSEYSNLTLNTSYKVKADNASSDSISLTTIHASKGLEYKVVILVDAGKMFNYNDLKNKIIIDNNLGITSPGIDYMNETVVDTLPKISAINLKNKKLFSDELRLLYVALTRAEKELFIVGEQTLKNYVASEFKIKKCNNYLSLILASLNESKFNELKNNGRTQLLYKQNPFANFVYIDTIENNVKLQAFILPKSNLELIEKYRPLLDEPKKQETKQVLKNTVTRILEDENSKKYFESLSYGEEEKLEAILQGNAYHKFFELFNVKAKDLSKEATRVLNLLKKDEQSLIDEKCINAFLKSDLIELMKKGEVLKEQKFVYKAVAKNLGLSGEDEILLQGIMDCLIVEEDGITIVDYKTSRANKNDLIKRYGAQLKLYGLACSQILHKKVKKIYLYAIFDANLIEVFE